MLDQWFVQDIEKRLKQKDRLVFIDESKQAAFLKAYLPKQYTVLEASGEIEELQVKYQIEKSLGGQKVVIYTPVPKEKLTFLREYCETDGVLEIRYFHNYIKEKIHEHLGLNIPLQIDELIAAAKNSIGKDHTYWMKLGKGLGDIFDLEKDLLPFLHAPKKYLADMDKDVREIFLQKVNQLTGQAYVAKPPETLAKEVVQRLFEGLIDNNPDKLLLQVYHQWLDSRKYEPSFQKYLDNYEVPSMPNPWSAHLDHPFRQLDEASLSALSMRLDDKVYRIAQMPKINQRATNRFARQMGITFWKDVKVLLEFDATNINYLNSFQETVEFYTTHFWKVDRAIRYLYTEFLNKPAIIRPFQEYFEQLNSILLDKWFRYIAQYQPKQTGLLEHIIQEHGEKTAVIVGDGVSYEIARGVAERIEKDFNVQQDIVLADFPSETENNMSKLYQSSGAVEPLHKTREAFLSAHCGGEVEFVHLDDVNEMTGDAPYLVCTYKDIDALGEKMQQRALKHFETIEETLATKIALLLRSGYRKVFLVADHGFVLTGLLSEADKIEVDFQGKVSKSERYVRTEEKQRAGDTFVEMEQAYKGYRYIYFSKNTRPFKTPGVYGYSHGGLTPQEIITPCFLFESGQHLEKQLSVRIINKAGLAQVTGELFVITLEALQGDGSLFANQRKCQLLFFAAGKQYNKSEIFTLSAGDTIQREYEFDGKKELEVVLLDAGTKEQLDKATVKKDSSRDLGGLL